MVLKSRIWCNNYGNCFPPRYPSVHILSQIAMSWLILDFGSAEMKVSRLKLPMSTKSMLLFFDCINLEGHDFALECAGTKLEPETDTSTKHFTIVRVEGPTNNNRASIRKTEALCLHLIIAFCGYESSNYETFRPKHKAIWFNLNSSEFALIAVCLFCIMTLKSHRLLICKKMV